MYVGKQHTSKVTIKDVLAFTCGACGHQADALVTGIGSGSGISPFSLDDSGSKERASSSAAEAARANLAVTVGLARCPACRTRDDRGVRRQKLKAILTGLAFLPLMVILGVVLDFFKPDMKHLGIWICAPVGVILVPFMYWSTRWKWTTVDTRVVFVRRSGSVPLVTPATGARAGERVESVKRGAADQ